MNVFKDWIVDLQLIELYRIGARFTWTNNEDIPVRFVLDRVFVTPDWEASPIALLRWSFVWDRTTAC